MKPITLLILLFSFLSENIYSQNQNDLIFKQDGKVLQVNIKKIGTEDITFIYPNEKIEISLKKADVSKIIFASGRVEEVSKPNNTLEKKETIEAPKTIDAQLPLQQALLLNTISICPVYFIQDGDFMIAYSTKAQTYIDNFIRRKGKYQVELQDIRTVNSNLRKANIAPEHINDFSIAELSKSLNTEYIMLLNVTKTTIGQDQKLTANNINIYGDKNNYITANSTTKAKYDVMTQIYIYKKDGSLVFERSVRPFDIGAEGLEQEEYENHINFLIKKTPFYKK